MGEMIEIKNVSEVAVTLSCGTEISPKSSVRMLASDFAQSAHWARGDMRLFVQGEGSGDDRLLEIPGDRAAAHRAVRGSGDAEEAGDGDGKAGKARGKRSG